MARITGMWAFNKITGFMASVTVQQVIADVERDQPEWMPRCRIALCLCNGGMLETQVHAYSTNPAQFRQFISRAA